jgi:putative salt-induced outer membrane protein
MKRMLAPTLFVLLVSSAARAQTPADTAPKPVPTPPPLWSGEGELSLVSTSGNTDTETLGGAFHLAYRPSPWNFEFHVGYIRSEADGEENAESLLSWLRGGYLVTERLELFGRAEYFRNTFAGVDRRLSAEFGAGYALLTEPPHLLKVEAALGYTDEDRLLGEDLSYVHARLGALYEWRISKTTTFTDEFRFTASLEEFDLWRIFNKASLTASMTSVFALKISHALEYVNEPAPGFENEDSVFSAAVVAKF